MTWRTLQELADDPALLAIPATIIPNVAYAGCLTLLSGREKVGKSTVLGQMIAEVSRGEGVFGTFGGSRQCALLAIDEWLGFAVQRLQRHGADAGVLLTAERLEVDALADLLVASGVDFLTIDNLREFAMGYIKDSNVDIEWVPLMGGLRLAAQRSGAGIILTHHNTKGGDDFSGSTQIGAGVDVLVNMTRDKDDPEGPRRRFAVKGRLPVHSFTAELIDGRYVVDAGAALVPVPPVQRVIDCVRRHPGCSMRSLLADVKGTRTDAHVLVTRLIDEGRIINAGTPTAMALFLPSSIASSNAQETPQGTPIGTPGNGGVTGFGGASNALSNGGVSVPKESVQGTRDSLRYETGLEEVAA